MMQPEVQGKKARQATMWAALAGSLLGLCSTTAWAQPAEPAARPATSAEQPDPAATSPVAKPTPAASATATPDKPAAAKPGTPGATAEAKTPLPPGTSIKVERTASGAKLFRITEGLLVEGQMQRPNAFLVLQRATVDYDYEALSESFLPRILAATREPPF